MDFYIGKLVKILSAFHRLFYIIFRRMVHGYRPGKIIVIINAFRCLLLAISHCFIREFRGAWCLLEKCDPISPAFDVFIGYLTLCFGYWSEDVAPEIF